jgi:hypothetical protein
MITNVGGGGILPVSSGVFGVITQKSIIGIFTTAKPQIPLTSFSTIYLQKLLVTYVMKFLKYPDTTPESRNSGARVDVHCYVAAVTNTNETIELPFLCNGEVNILL